MTKRLITAYVFFAVVALGQATFSGPGGTLNVTVDPAGTCAIGSNLQYNTSNGKLWGCDNGTWTQIGSAGGTVAWGSITGTLSSQTDLQTALNAKLTSILTSANIFVGNGSNVATGVAVTGDAGISNAGVWTNTGMNGGAVAASSHLTGTDSGGKIVPANAHDVSVPLSCTAAGASGTAYTCSTSPSFTPAAKDLINFCPDVANTGAATLVVNSQAGTPAIQKQQGQAALVANDLRASPACVTMEFNGTNWVMQGQAGNALSSAQSGVLASAFVATTQGTNSTSFVDLSTADTVTFSCTATCNFIVQYSAVVANATNVTVSCYSSVFIDTVQADDGAQATALLGVAGFAYATQTVAGWKASSQSSGSHTVNVKHKSSSSSTCNWNDRFLAISIAP